MAYDKLLPTKWAFALHANSYYCQHKATTIAINLGFKQIPEAFALIAEKEAHINQLTETLSKFINGNISANILDKNLKSLHTLLISAAFLKSNISLSSNIKQSEMLLISLVQSILIYSEFINKLAGEFIYNYNFIFLKHNTIL